MDRDDDIRLWDLLGQNKAPEASPFFARNVLRQVRERPGWRTRLAGWFSVRRLVPAAGLAVVLIAGMLMLHHPTVRQRIAAADADPITKIDPQDYDVVADLDNLLASEDNNLWDDDSTL